MGVRNGEGNGQAPTQTPAPATGNGQAPTDAQANNGGSPSTTPNGQAPTATTQTFTPPSEADWKRNQQELAEARRDAAKARDEAKKLTDAQLSAEEKLKRDFTELQAKTAAQEAKLQQQNLQLAGYRLGASLGIGDISAALALVQAEHGSEVKYADDGTPENISELLKAVLKDHPVLAAQASGLQQQKPAASSGGATNPGANARSGVITRSSYVAMSAQERIARNKEVLEVMRQNGGRLPD